MNITRVHQIEISSRCNLACGYCPHPGLRREKADMSWETFNAALDWAADLGGPELSLTGMGEAMLHPLFVPMLRRARERLPHAWLLLATNGLVLVKNDKEEEVAAMLHALRAVGATVFVSMHRPEVAGPAIELLRAVGVTVGSNSAFVTSGFDWAGQVEWHGLPAPKSVCQYIAQGWATVLQDGSIVNCCMDAHGLYPIGNVMDAVKPTRIDAIPLCTNCHLEVPDGH
jgi:hypothetical protein